jgi:hypothetical protein
MLLIPSGRQLCQAGLCKTNPVTLLEVIAHARNAILDRVEDGHSKSPNGEQAALRQGMAALDRLRRITERQMATSQRLVDPYRQIRMPTSHNWQDYYRAALLETDWTKMQERIQTAESEIHKRRLLLVQDHGGTSEEREALVSALSSLTVLRMDAASWLERNRPGTAA